jgi:nucleoside-diphosphate-sugar epimerase
MNKASELVAEECKNSVAQRLAALAPLKSATIVVTGGTGFFGKWLAESIAVLNDMYAFGIECHLVARGVDGFRATCPHLAQRKDIHLVRCDVRYLNEFPSSTQWVVHAAATPDNRLHASNPVEVMGTIAEGTTNVLRLAARCADLRMIANVSSGHVYGLQPIEAPSTSENAFGRLSCSEPSSAYAEAKRFAETLCAAARTQAHLPVVTLRPFAFIGPYQSLETPWAINNFLRDALHGKAIRVFGNGQTVRSYMYGSDLATWVLSILVGAKSGRAYNLGSSEPISIEAVARLIAACVNPAPDVILGSALESHPNVSRFVPDTTAAKRDFGLDVATSLETAVRRTVAWHRALTG